jgi:osomolarity two-component system, response regulator SSK1
MEWGCMQALIDFDGWRKWKDFSQNVEEENKKTPINKGKARKNRISLGSCSNGAALIGSMEKSEAR